MSLIFKDNSLYITNGKSSLINMNLSSLIELLKKDSRSREPKKMVYLYENKKIKAKLFINQLTLVDNNISNLNCRVLIGKPSKN